MWIGELLANKSQSFLLLSDEDLWLSFGNERNRYRWTTISA
jgi:hypothetical protein